MIPHGRTPLVWKLLVHDKKRLFLSVTGVAFAVFLMFIEMGFLNGVFDSQTLLVRHLNADLIMVHYFKDDLTPPKPFSRQRLTQARQIDGVEAVFPVYFEVRGQWKSLHDRIDRIAVIAFDPEHPVFAIPELQEYKEILKQPDTALTDAKSRRFYGALAPGSVAELNGRRVKVVGSYRMGPDFVVDGCLIMSDRNFVTYFPDERTGKPNFDRIELGLIKVSPGVDVEALRARIEPSLPADVRVVTKEGLTATIKRFWARNRPVGLIFGLGMLVGFVIGVTICYQILFNDVNDHQAEFATLKAIGYGNGFLVGVVIREALYLSLLGFLPGLLFGYVSYSTLEVMTGISMMLTPLRIVAVAAMTVLMCLISSLFAIRKVLGSDPAEVF